MYKKTLNVLRNISKVILSVFVHLFHCRIVISTELFVVCINAILPIRPKCDCNTKIDDFVLLWHILYAVSWKKRDVI